MNKREANQQARTVARQVERRQDFVSGTSNLPPTVTSTVPQPKLDATDRRYIEAQNEDKAHTTKETLDDIKRVHQKEKRKKEQTDIKLHQAGNFSQGPVSKEIICDYTLLNSFKVILEQ